MLRGQSKLQGQINENLRKNNCKENLIPKSFCNEEEQHKQSLIPKFEQDITLSALFFCLAQGIT